MKEEKFSLNSFIGGWYINPKICDDIVKWYEANPRRHVQGKVGQEQRVDDKFKKAMEINLPGQDTFFDKYNEQLQQCLVKYMKRYPEVNTHYASFTSALEGYNIQKYLPGEGFYKIHCERDNGFTKRCLVFMTYLNDVKDGGTHFKYQRVTSPAKKGLTLIWPTDFTHMHQGQIAKETKYIITGWYNFIT